MFEYEPYFAPAPAGTGLQAYNVTFVVDPLDERPGRPAALVRVVEADGAERELLVPWEALDQTVAGARAALEEWVARVWREDAALFRPRMPVYSKPALRHASR